jgi:hypothetical protein
MTCDDATLSGPARYRLAPPGRVSNSLGGTTALTAQATQWSARMRSASDAGRSMRVEQGESRDRCLMRGVLCPDPVADGVRGPGPAARCGRAGALSHMAGRHGGADADHPTDRVRWSRGGHERPLRCGRAERGDALARCAHALGRRFDDRGSDGSLGVRRIGGRGSRSRFRPLPAGLRQLGRAGGCLVRRAATAGTCERGGQPRPGAWALRSPSGPGGCSGPTGAVS